MGTIHAAIDTGDLISNMPDRGQLEQNEFGDAPAMAPQMGEMPMEQPPQPDMMGQGQ
jgi:hypothetical protein